MEDSSCRVSKVDPYAARSLRIYAVLSAKGTHFYEEQSIKRPGGVKFYHNVQDINVQDVNIIAPLHENCRGIMLVLNTPFQLVAPPLASPCIALSLSFDSA